MFSVWERYIYILFNTYFIKINTYVTNYFAFLIFYSTSNRIQLFDK